MGCTPREGTGLQALTAHPRNYASTPGLGLQRKIAEDLGVNLVVDFLGQSPVL